MNSYSISKFHTSRTKGHNKAEFDSIGFECSPEILSLNSKFQNVELSKSNSLQNQL